MFKLSRKPAGPGTISDEDTAALPDPVREYLRHVQMVGGERIQAVRLQQEGFYRMRESMNWRPITCEQYIIVQPPGFLWYGWVQPRGFMSIDAKEMYIRGKGGISVKKRPFITHVNAMGTEIAMRCLVRFLGEMVWYPSAFLSDCIKWETLDHRSAKAVIKYGGVDNSLFFYWNPENELTEAVGASYRIVDRQPVLENWTISFKNYQELNGILVPLTFEASWNLKHSKFPYFKGNVTDIEYNKLDPY